MVKVSSPRNLDDAIRAAYDLESTVKSLKALKGGKTYKGPATQKTFLDKGGPSKAKPFPPPRTKQLDVATRRKLREEGKCFYCKKTWELGHRCQGKGQVHYIEVLFEESDNSDLDLGVDILDQESPKVEGSLGSMIASLHRVKKYLTLKVVGQASGQDVMVLIDPGASHNFIDAGFVEKNLKTKGFKGFKVSNVNGKLMLVDHIIERFVVRLQSYTVKENFYVYPLKGHPHIILGVQWLFDLSDIHTNYQELTMSFEIDGKTHTL